MGSCSLFQISNINVYIVCCSIYPPYLISSAGILSVPGALFSFNFIIMSLLYKLAVLYLFHSP